VSYPLRSVSTSPPPPLSSLTGAGEVLAVGKNNNKRKRKVAWFFVFPSSCPHSDKLRPSHTHPSPFFFFFLLLAGSFLSLCLQMTLLSELLLAVESMSPSAMVATSTIGVVVAWLLLTRV